MPQEENDKRIYALEMQSALAAQEVRELKEAVTELTKEFAEIRKTFTSSKGFFAGILAVLAPLWAIAVALVSTVFHKFFEGQ